MGDLIVHVLRQAGDSALPVIPGLLRALLARLSTAKTASFSQVTIIASRKVVVAAADRPSQSLIMPFALLIYLQPDAVLELVEQIGSLPDTTESALHLLVRSWCDHVETWQGFWNNRVSALALANLLLSSKASLKHIVVRGNLIVEPSAGKSNAFYSDFAMVAARRLTRMIAGILTRSMSRSRLFPASIHVAC